MSSQAVRLDAYEHIFTIFDVPANKSDVRLLIESTLKDDHAEIAVWCRQGCFTDLLNEPFGAKAIANQLRDSDDLQLVVHGEVNQVRNAGHRSVFFHDFANDASRCESGDSRQVHRCLRLTRPNQHAAVARAQREDMS